MVPLFLASLALAGAPAGSDGKDQGSENDTGDTDTGANDSGEPETPPPAKPAPKVFDVTVSKPAAPAPAAPAPAAPAAPLGGDITPKPLPAGAAAKAPTPAAPAAPAPAAAAAPAPAAAAAPAPAAPAPAAPPPATPAPRWYDVTVTKPPPVLDVSVARPGEPLPAAPSPAPSAPAPLGGDITPPPLPPGTAPAPPRTVTGVAPATPAPAETALGAQKPATPVPPAPPGVGLRIEDGEPWSVHDATGARYDTIQFARIVNDRETLTRLDNRREFNKIGSTSLAIGGAALLLTSLIVVTSDAGAPSELDYAVNPDDYQSKEDYQVATDFSQGQYDKALSSWQSQRLGTTLFLAGAGGLVLGSAPFVGRGGDPMAKRPDLAYTPERAREWVDGYNAAHPPAGGAEAPKPAPPPVQPEADVPEAPDEPPPGEVAPTPGHSGPLDLEDGDDGGGSSGSSPIRLQLLVGPGLLGLSGRF